ncbi:MAG TPA: peptide-methionine (S)-S-oxide reductase, partial [Planctomycetota bacterium]|nr:peptide-methionine (S)-S-oxide reductase [Planctomycetota bacterium]
TNPSPTYRSMGDHTEAFQVDYDPARTTYGDLLDAFWASHDPSARKWSVQYANLVLAHDDAQERAARESAARLAAGTGREVRTEIRRLDRFWPAEDYHQKYALRGDARLMDLVRPFAPDDEALRESPLAARLNAFAAGDLGFKALREECGTLGWIVEGDGRPERIRARASESAAAR